MCDMQIYMKGVYIDKPMLASLSLSLKMLICIIYIYIIYIYNIYNIYIYVSLYLVYMFGQSVDFSQWIF